MSICKYCIHYDPRVKGPYCKEEDVTFGPDGVANCVNFSLATQSERVDHPSYYQGKIEVIDFIEDKELGFHLGNAIKYISRAGKKTPDAKEDIEKAIWYLERYLSKCGL